LKGVLKTDKKSCLNCFRTIACSKPNWTILEFLPESDYDRAKSDIISFLYTQKETQKLIIQNVVRNNECAITLKLVLDKRLEVLFDYLISIRIEFTQCLSDLIHYDIKTTSLTGFDYKLLEKVIAKLNHREEIEVELKNELINNVLVRCYNEIITLFILKVKTKIHMAIDSYLISLNKELVQFRLINLDEQILITESNIHDKSEIILQKEDCRTQTIKMTRICKNAQEKLVIILKNYLYLPSYFYYLFLSLIQRILFVA